MFEFIYWEVCCVTFVFRHATLVRLRRRHKLSHQGVWVLMLHGRGCPVLFQVVLLSLLVLLLLPTTTATAETSPTTAAHATTTASVSFSTLPQPSLQHLCQHHAAVVSRFPSVESYALIATDSPFGSMIPVSYRLQAFFCCASLTV